MAKKRLKQDNGKEQDQGPEATFKDLISELPDAIILHILSFLPSLNAVRTTLASRRWRRMWAAVSVLDFYDSRNIPWSGRHDKAEKFYEFADKCLLRHLLRCLGE